MSKTSLIFTKGSKSNSTFTFHIESDQKSITSDIPDQMLRKGLGLFPTVSENDVVRHFISLSSKNYGVDTGFYPLGSCTMKYNPKINERLSALPGFTNMHPDANQDRVQGLYEIMDYCNNTLLELSGMDAGSLAPCAGAHGELAAMFVIKAYFDKKNQKRDTVLVPDSAHGTNPASASMAGYKVVTVKSDADGFVDLNDLKDKVSNNVASFMLTNPNTLGLYEVNIDKIVDICHSHDVQLYYDGANLNAILGISRPGDTGFDVVHFNLHKTFSTPHGGGGPGSGPIAVKSHLAPFLPNEDVVKDAEGHFSMLPHGEQSVGKIRSYYANIGIVIRAAVYMFILGKEGFTKSGLLALLNANYLAKKLSGDFTIATKHHVMHEFVISLSELCGDCGVTVMDFTKRILDYGVHAPTVSFPLIVPDCLMIEPTETESIETLDNFISVMKSIRNETAKDCDLLHNAPFSTPVLRADEVTAARKPVLRYTPEMDGPTAEVIQDGAKSCK
jgi:glycine dehydrogenase subunit 2